MIENFRPQGFLNQHARCETPQSSDLLFCFRENELLLRNPDTLPRGEDLKQLIRNENSELYCFGTFQQARCLLLTGLADPAFSGEHFQWRNIRSCQASLSDALFRIAGLARQLHYWRSTHRHCGHCGTPTLDKKEERAKICPHCQLISYPQLYPCIIVLVTRGPELLLARSPGFAPGIYSTLAGFIEPGESAENAVYREVKEETGIAVQNIRYRLSQPWPFPNSLMLGFLADYAGGEITIEPGEIEDAQWFQREHLPPLPNPLSISRLLIEKHLQHE